MTPKQFREFREAVGFTIGPSRDPLDFSTDQAIVKKQRKYLSWLLNVRADTIAKWERDTGTGPHPVSARICEWIMDGSERPSVQDPDMDGTAFAEARESLGLTREQLGAILDVPTDMLEIWETDRGPHPSAVAVVSWMLSGWKIPAQATDDRAAAVR